MTNLPPQAATLLEDTWCEWQYDNLEPINEQLLTEWLIQNGFYNDN